jgi:hypothetical protein
LGAVALQTPRQWLIIWIGKRSKSPGTDLADYSAASFPRKRAKAGTHGKYLEKRHFLLAWIPACAGMTASPEIACPDFCPCYLGCSSGAPAEKKEFVEAFGRRPWQRQFIEREVCRQVTSLANCHGIAGLPCPEDALTSQL